MDKQNNYEQASHGNYHAFCFENKHFFYDIESVAVYEIEESLYNKLISNRVDSDFYKNFLTFLPNQDKKNNSKPANNSITNIVLNVAQVCNLSCVYCYGIDGEYGTKGYMSEETAYKSIDFLFRESNDSSQVSITFFGGEPLLNFKLLKKAVDYSLEKAQKAGKKIVFSITTNGTKFNDEINAFLNKHNFSVTVSFDGDEEIQDKNRPFKGGKGSFKATKPKIENFLKSRNGMATARATVTNHSHDLVNLKNNLKKFGFKSAGVTVATLSNFALNNRDVDEVNSLQYQSILDAIDVEATEIKKLIQDRGDVSHYNDSPIINFISQLRHKNKLKHPCGVGRKMVGISITGDIYPCHRFVGNDKFKLGNIDDFKNESRDTYVKDYTSSHPVCSQCWAKYSCGGRGCIHDNEVTKGDVDNVNVEHCTAIKYNLKHAITLFSSLNASEKSHLFKFIK